MRNLCPFLDKTPGNGSSAMPAGMDLYRKALPAIRTWFFEHGETGLFLLYLAVVRTISIPLYSAESPVNFSVKNAETRVFSPQSIEETVTKKETAWSLMLEMRLCQTSRRRFAGLTDRP